MEERVLNRIISDKTEELIRNAERADALAKAWEAVEFPTKKNGEEFSVFSKNFSNCRISTKSYAMFDFEKEISVWTRTVNGTMVEDSIDTYEALSGYTKYPRATDHPERVTKPSTYLVPFYVKSVDDVKEDIAQRINYWNNIADGYRQKINQIETVVRDQIIRIYDMMSEFKTEHGDLAGLVSEIVKENWYSFNR